MKIKAARFVLVPGLVLLVIAMSTANGLAGPETAKTNHPAKTTTAEAKDTVKGALAEGKDAIRQGVDKTDKAVTNAVHHISVDAHKATEMAIDVAAKVKVTVTNAVGEVTKAIKDATR